MEIRAYLDHWDEAEVDHRYPHARRFLTGSMFICHAGADFPQIVSKIAAPVLMDRYGDGYFLHNRRSGGSGGYKVLVRAALHWCDQFIVVVSCHAKNHAWVWAEIDWLLHQKRVLITCLFDDTQPRSAHPHLGRSLTHAEDQFEVDFRADAVRAQADLAQIVDDRLKLYPYPRFPDGPPTGPGTTEATNPSSQWDSLAGAELQR